MRDILLNRIWVEMKQSNTNMYYAELMIDKQIYSSKLYNSAITVCSTGGALLGFISLYIPFASASVIAIVSIINQFHPVFFIKSEDLTQLCNLRTDYGIFFNRLQNIFALLNADRVPEEEAQNIFTDLIEENATKQTNLSRIFGKVNIKMQQEAALKSDNYLNSIYNNG